VSHHPGRPNGARRFVTVLDQPGELISEAADVLRGVSDVITPPSQEDQALGPLFAEAEAVLTWGNTKLVPALLDRCSPRLRLISVMGTGTDNVDLDWATAHGVPVCNTPGVNAYAVAEYTLGMMLVALRNILPAEASIRRGDWVLAEDFTGLELRGRTVGIVGLGNIGRTLARLLSGLGCRLLGYDPYVSPETAAAVGVDLVGLDEVCRRADVITLHLPLTPETKHVLGGDRLKLLRDGAWVINAARAPVVDEDALVKELSTRLGGYVTDVFPTEPPDLSRPIYKLKNVFATPHIAAMTVTALNGMQVEAAVNIRTVLSGEPPRNVVNGAGLRKQVQAKGGENT
jgi:D-3-phosphoglycerate dehydrogenase